MRGGGLDSNAQACVGTAARKGFLIGQMRLRMSAGAAHAAEGVLRCAARQRHARSMPSLNT